MKKTKPTINIKKLQKASRQVMVRKVSEGIYMVHTIGKSHSEHRVLVSYNPENTKWRITCTCDWFRYGGINCKHVLAVLRTIAKDRNKDISFWDSCEKAKQQKYKTVKINDSLWVTLKNRSKQLVPK